MNATTPPPPLANPTSEHHMTHRIAPVLLVALLTSCSSSKHTLEKGATHSSTIDTCLWLRGLSSSFDIECEYIITPLHPNAQELHCNPQELRPNLQPFPIDPQHEHEEHAENAQRFGSLLPYYYTSAQTSAFIPYKISFNLHGSKRDTLQEQTISKHRADSTFLTEVVQDTTTQLNVSSWWLKLRYRAFLCLSLLLLPFAIVGIIRIYRGYKGKQ